MIKPECVMKNLQDAAHCMYESEGCHADRETRNKCREIVKGKMYNQLQMEIDFLPNNKEDLTIIQYLIADTAKAILENYGTVARIGRGWKELPFYEPRK